MSSVAETGLKVCGTKKKSALNPWLDDHEQDIEDYQKRISDLTKRIEREHNPQVKELIKDERKRARKEYKKAKLAWENEFWMTIVDECKEAERKNNSRTLYKTLRQIGLKDTRTIEDEFFTPEEYRSHFMKVSERRNERELEDLMKLADEMIFTPSPNTTAANAKLDAEITYAEFEEELGKMRDGAPGVDGVKVSAIKALRRPERMKIFESMMEYLGQHHSRWPEEMKEGWMIPLHKKGARDDMNNYRGVCLLPLFSRLAARIYATRMRIWAEEIGALDENQNGFRCGRSTCDSTQILIRVEEETRKVLGPSENPEGRPGAVLLDITKAYPRVNRPLIWQMLERMGMPNRTMQTLIAMHEGTTYRIKGKAEMSEEWLPARGLREGCATSPILFNIYHAEAMRRASKKRKEKATESNLSCGLEWSWVPGRNFPALDPKRTISSSAREDFTVEDSLFADDSSLIGWHNELLEGKEIVKKTMLEFEEKCHDGKEEMFTFGSTAAHKSRMLGTLLGNKEDTASRIKRGHCAAAKIRRWQWKSKLNKRTKSLVVQAVVESTMLFDCNARSWTNSEIKRLQSVVDKSYRRIWNNGQGLALKRMERERVNMFQVRNDVEITSLRTKIEVRSLQRAGHVLRMPDTRLTKKVVLGRWRENRRGKGMLRGGLISY